MTLAAATASCARRRNLRPFDPTESCVLLGGTGGKHNRRMAIKRGDKLILSLGGVIAAPVVAATDEKKQTVKIQIATTWDVVNTRNVERAD